jgi:hypothetical protein
VIFHLQCLYTILRILSQHAQLLLDYLTSSAEIKNENIIHCYSSRQTNSFNKIAPFESCYTTICMWIRSREGFTMGCCHWNCQSASDSWGPQANSAMYTAVIFQHVTHYRAKQQIEGGGNPSRQKSVIGI